MSASGGTMWTSIFVILACFMPNALFEETKEHPTIGKQYFLTMHTYAFLFGNDPLNWT